MQVNIIVPLPCALQLVDLTVFDFDCPESQPVLKHKQHLAEFLNVSVNVTWCNGNDAVAEDVTSDR